jgi:hypothetical protein
MTDEMTNLVLEHLRKIRESQELMHQDIQDLKLRMSAVEHHLGQVQVQLAGLNSRMDRFDERLARIERRLNLVDV